VCGSTKKEGRLDWTEDKGGGKRFEKEIVLKGSEKTFERNS
jgi:hypothetical protein